MQQYNIHPAAEAFPLMDDRRFAELVEDIRIHGQIEAITVHNGLIIDGRNRYKACQELGIKPITKDYVGNPWDYVWSLNGQRRDLSAEQRYLIWHHCNANSASHQADLQRIQDEANRKRSEAAIKQHEVSKPYAGEEMVRGQSVPTPSNAPRPGKQAKAAAAKVNLGAVARGDKLINTRPDLAEKVRLGKITPAKAHNIVRQAEIQQLRKSIDNGELVLPAGKYEVVVIDPPWQYADKGAAGIEAYNPDSVRGVTPYPTMSLDDIINIKLPITDDAVVFLWTTHAFLRDAFAVLDTWGLDYKAVIVWDKQKMGLGRNIRMQCEFCLLATRGKPVLTGSSVRDIIHAPRREHSRKPDEFYELVDRLTVGRKLDYFAREKRKGWEVCGVETSKF